MSLLLFQPPAGGIIYAKTGSLVAGTRLAGTATFTASVTVLLVTDTSLGGTSLKVAATAAKTASLTTATRISGADVHEASRTGSVSTSPFVGGADSEHFSETGSVSTRPEFTGVKSLSSGNQYTKTGTFSAGTKISAPAQEFTPSVYIKTAALSAGASLSGELTGGAPTTPGRPIVSEVAEELYVILKPVAYADQELEWPLLKYCETVAGNVQLVKNYGEDWSQILDIDRAPHDGLPWLAQLVGATVDSAHSGESVEDYDVRVRDYIRSTPGFNRGTLTSMIASIKQHLTGTKTVIIRERQGGAYKLQIRTKANETANEAMVLEAISWQKPAGITLDYDVLGGQDYQQLYDDYATYQALYVDYATYNGVYLDLPGT